MKSFSIMIEVYDEKDGTVRADFKLLKSMERLGQPITYFTKFGASVDELDLVKRAKERSPTLEANAYMWGGHQEVTCSGERTVVHAVQFYKIQLLSDDLQKGSAEGIPCVRWKAESQARPPPNYRTRPEPITH